MDAEQFVKLFLAGGLPAGALARIDPHQPFGLPGECRDLAMEVVAERGRRRAHPPQPPATKPAPNKVEPCPACQGSVSAAARACPHCGHPLRVQVQSPKETRGSAGNVVAAIASLILPGLGQLAQGRGVMALVAFLVTAVLWTILLGWLGHIWAAWDAAVWTHDRR